METTFKISKAGKYIDIKYIVGIKLPMSVYDNVLVSSAKEGRKLIKLIRDFEKGVKEELVKQGVDLDYRMIMIRHLQVIDSIASGLDIRSKMSVAELSDRFVFGYNRMHESMIDEVEETLKYFNEVKAESSYMKDWRRFDKYNEYIRDYSLNYPQISMDDFGKDPLKKMEALANEMLETLIKDRKK